ncbi:MAG: TetR/AcrR family transcriptional regulator, regulator of mycofactocin system [Acidimicrobiaceae bacterium]|nr:TetR/AcrR family transcriptional regulator, regulator of mycofactocin system [Acidimicrobiaceae bacterium]
MSIGDRLGRPPATSRGQLERVALRLFHERGFEGTTVDDIAEAAGVSRRTFFRYFASKNDVVWGDFDSLLSGMDDWLAGAPRGAVVLGTLAEAVVRFNSVAPEALPAHRERMALILHVPALQAHSTLRYADWRQVVARFAARQLCLPIDDFIPQLVGHVALAAAVAAYEHWLADPDASLAELLRRAFDALPVITDVNFSVDYEGSGEVRS